jgi:hypothetical protein
VHRVFRLVDGASAGRRDRFEELRAFLRSLGLVEDVTGESYRYRCTRPDGSLGWLATVHGGRRGATIYLYPDALGRRVSRAEQLYRMLDEAGAGMGSKAGPSIDVDLDDAVQVRLLREGMRALLADDRAPRCAEGRTT